MTNLINHKFFSSCLLFAFVWTGVSANIGAGKNYFALLNLALEKKHLYVEIFMPSAPVLGGKVSTANSAGKLRIERKLLEFEDHRAFLRLPKEAYCHQINSFVNYQAKENTGIPEQNDAEIVLSDAEKMVESDLVNAEHLTKPPSRDIFEIYAIYEFYCAYPEKIYPVDLKYMKNHPSVTSTVLKGNINGKEIQGNVGSNEMKINLNDHLY